MREAIGTAAAIRTGDLSPREAVQESLDAIAAADGEINAFLEVFEEDALERADDLEDMEDPGPLHGVPLAIKDNMCLAGHRLTCASRILEDYVAPYTATAVQRCLDAGAVIVGRTNMDEFAMGSTTEHSAWGPTSNPRDTARTPGGSSGGSAAAVAGAMTPLALGSDTGGSVRQPAALCGIVGAKPTYGRVSRYGLVAFGSSLDQISPFASTVADAALLLEVLCGHDERDPTTLRGDDADGLLEAAQRGADRGLDGVRIGVVPDHLEAEGVEPGVTEQVRAGLAAMESAGATVVNVELPSFDLGVPAYFVTATSEASSNLARYDGVRYGRRGDADASDLTGLLSIARGQGFGEEVQRRILLGTFSLSAGYAEAWYSQALRVRRLLLDETEAAFAAGVDLLACPTSPFTAFPLGDRADDPLAEYLCDAFTVAANLTGLPAMSVPCGLAEGLPVGLHLTAPALAEDRLFTAAAALEGALA